MVPACAPRARVISAGEERASRDGVGRGRSHYFDNLRVDDSDGVAPFVFNAQFCEFLDDVVGEPLVDAGRGVEAAEVFHIDIDGRTTRS